MNRFKTSILAATIIASSGLMMAGTAYAQVPPRSYSIPAQDLGEALRQFALESGQDIAFDPALVAGKRSKAVTGEDSAEESLRRLLDGTGLRARKTASGFAIVAAATSAAEPSAQLAEPAEAALPDDNEVIVVTGTNIRGARSASPTTVIDRRDIERSGLATTQQLVDRLPQQFSGNASENTIGGVTGAPQSGFNVSAGSGLDLRGLGTDSTLVLVNGRRIATTGIGNFVDLSLIPLSAVDRVEVVTDGASAIYGSDAVGGVANFIMREDFDGAESRARFGTVTKGDSREYMLGQVFGGTWSGGNILASYEFYKRTDLDSNDRSFSEDADDPFDLLPDQKRHSLFVTANQSIGGSLRLFADAHYARRKSRADFHFFELEPDVSGATTKQIGFTTGARLDLGRRWQIEARGTYDHNDTNQLSMFGSDFTGKSTSFDIKADGSLLSIGGGDIRLALGGQYRRETLRRKRFDPVLNFDFDVGGKRDVWAGFVEAFIPIVGSANASPGLEILEVTAAGRFDHYSDFGDTFNPKIGVLWSPVKGLKLRGSYGTSFRAPLLFELDESGALYIPFPAADPISPTGITNTLIIQGGNADLEPEKAKTFSLGFDYSPSQLPALDISANFFNIDFKNRIGDPPLDPFFNFGLAGGAGVEPYLTRNVPQSVILDFASRPGFLNFFGIPLDEINAVLDFSTTNLAKTRVRGIDGNIRYHFTTGAGRFDLGLAATYLIDHKTKFTPDGEFEELVDTRFNPVDLVATASLGWSHAGWAANAFINYTDSYKDPTSDPDRTFDIDSWTTLDLNLQYDTGATPRVAALRNLVFSLSVLNLFDSDPPIVRNPDGINFDGANANALGRFVAFQLTKRW